MNIIKHCTKKQQWIVEYDPWRMQRQIKCGIKSTLN